MLHADGEHVLGYHADTDCEQQFTYSVLENFWPAIHRGDLAVNVSDLVIDARSLPGLLQQYSAAHADFTAHPFYRAYTEAAATATTLTLTNLQEATVRLLIGDQNTPNQIARVRRTGMVIYHRRVRGRVPCHGGFECRNDVGNRLLRDMEPPRHDDRDADLPEKGANRHLKRELDNFILDCVKALAPVSAESTLTSKPSSGVPPSSGRYLLRSGMIGNADDVPGASFQVTLDVESDKTNCYLTATVQCSSRTLRRAITKGTACFTLHVECSNTLFRRIFDFNADTYRETIPASRRGVGRSRRGS